MKKDAHFYDTALQGSAQRDLWIRAVGHTISMGRASRREKVVFKPSFVCKTKPRGLGTFRGRNELEGEKQKEKEMSKKEILRYFTTKKDNLRTTFNRKVKRFNLVCNLNQFYYLSRNLKGTKKIEIMMESEMGREWWKGHANKCKEGSIQTDRYLERKME